MAGCGWLGICRIRGFVWLRCRIRFGLTGCWKILCSTFEGGEKLHKVTLAVLAVQRKLRVSGALLKSTWAAIKGWKLTRPTRPRVPITRYLLEALVVAGFSRGAGDIGLRRRRWFGAALGWWLAFDALLRPAEVLRLRHCDLAFPNSELHGPDPNLVVVIRNPKTRRVWKTQFVLCTEAHFD